MNLRVQRQGERKIERSLQRSTPSLHRDKFGHRKVNGGLPASGPDNDGYVRMSEDGLGRATPTTA